jgi:hypothetical protein
MIDEGYIKFESVWRETAALQHPEIDELIRWRRPLFAAGLIGQYADSGIGYGNISLRVSPLGRAQFIITATQTGHLPELTRQHFALVTEFNIASNQVHSSGATEASSESMTHAAIYQLDQRIRAVVHVHDNNLWLRLRDRVATTNSAIAYGTPAMAEEFSRLFFESDFSKSGIAVMAGHDEGLIATGQSMQEAAEKILSLHAEFG